MFSEISGWKFLKICASLPAPPTMSILLFEATEKFLNRAGRPPSLGFGVAGADFAAPASDIESVMKNGVLYAADALVEARKTEPVRAGTGPFIAKIF